MSQEYKNVYYLDLHKEFTETLANRNSSEYVTTKPIRVIAETYGIKVSVLCPTFVDTPIFQKAEAINMARALIMEQLKVNKPITAEKFAKIALKGIERNQLIICPMPLRKTIDICFTLFPFLHKKLMRFVCCIARKAKMKME